MKFVILSIKWFNKVFLSAVRAAKRARRVAWNKYHGAGVCFALKAVLWRRIHPALVALDPYFPVSPAQMLHALRYLSLFHTRFDTALAEWRGTDAEAAYRNSQKAAETAGMNDVRAAQQAGPTRGVGLCGRLKSGYRACEDARHERSNSVPAVRSRRVSCPLRGPLDELAKPLPDPCIRAGMA